MSVASARTDYHVEVDGKRVAVDSEGYLLDRSQWSPEFARALARREGLELTPAHWEVIDFLREFQPLLAADPCYSRFLQLEKGRGFDLATPGQRAAILNRSLCRLEGPLAWYGRMEQPADRYPEPDIAQQLARPAITPASAPAPRLRAA